MNPITREESLLDGQDLTPITRKEQFIKRIYDKTQEVPTPVTREEYFLKKAGEGTSPVTIEQLNVTENGTYSETGKAYSPVIVEVPAPTLITKTITENGTYNASEDNADGYSQVTVNVPLPQNAKLITSAENYPITDAADYPLPKCEVTVANADKCEVIVTSDNTITENNAPYLYRATPSGNKVLNELVGGTVAWNQLFPFDSDSYTLPIGLSVSITNGRMVANGTATSSATSTIMPSRIYNTIKPINTHKYLLHIDGTQNFNSFRLSIYGTTAQDISLSTMTSKVFNCTVANATESEFIASVTENNSYSADFTTYLIDLTQMFGTTIADYIYSLEQIATGNGIVWLKSYGFFTEDYYPYNAGELMSVKTSARKVYDSDSNLLATYLLSNIEFRGIPKLVNNQLVYDGDKYEGNGRVTRKYGVVDLGSLTWSAATSAAGTAVFISAIVEDIKHYSAEVLPNILPQNGYAVKSWNSLNAGADAPNGINVFIDGSIRVVDSSYSDANTFKTAMSGKYLVYEKSEATEENSTLFTNPQLAGSTEEFVDTREVAIPVGHESKYFNGEGYITYLEPNTSDTINMAQEHAIMPLETTYISANGTLDVEYWK